MITDDDIKQIPVMMNGHTGRAVIAPIRKIRSGRDFDAVMDFAERYLKTDQLHVETRRDELWVFPCVFLQPAEQANPNSGATPPMPSAA